MPHDLGLTTRELAAQERITEQAIRRRYSQFGHYHGVRPNKHPNGRLYWPLDTSERVMERK